MAKWMKAVVLMLAMLMTQCAAAYAVQAAEFTTRNEGTILMNPVVYFGSDKYKFHKTYDDRNYESSKNWVQYGFESKGDNTRIKDGKKYVEALAATGFFEIVDAVDDPKLSSWRLRYTGEKNIDLAKESGKSPKEWHVQVVVYDWDRSTGDEFNVFLVDGIEFDGIDNPKKNSEYTYRKSVTSSSSSNKNNLSAGASSNKKSSSDSKTGECPECEGTGKCSECGGSMWVWKNDWVYVNGLPEMQTVSASCQGTYCYGGSCSKCGGDGVI